MQGEGLMDKRVWIIKTHFPEQGGVSKFGVERAILLVRNPIDCLTSHFNFILAGKHDVSIENATYYKFWYQW